MIYYFISYVCRKEKYTGLQNALYAESLATDIGRELEQRQQQEALEQEQRQQQLAEAQQQASAEQRRLHRLALSAALPPEPLEGILVSVSIPGSQAIRRRFLATDPVDLLYTVVTANCQSLQP